MPTHKKNTGAKTMCILFAYINARGLRKDE